MTLSGFLLTQGGGSHRRDVGRILFWKRTRPTPRKKSTRAFRFALDPQRHKGEGLRALPFGNPSRSWTGERQRKEEQGMSYLHPVVLHARRCGGALI